MAKDGDARSLGQGHGRRLEGRGLFNRGELPQAKSRLKWSDLKLNGKQTVRDLWRQKDLGDYEGQFSAQVGRHGVVLIRLRPAE